MLQEPGSIHQKFILSQKILYIAEALLIANQPDCFLICKNVVKKMPLLILFFLSATIAFASHIVGGEVYYKYLGPGSTAGSSKYEISLRLFRDCNVPCGDGTNVACLPLRPSVTIYSAASPYIRARILGLPLRDSLSLTLTTYPSCVAYKPSVCYEVKIYSDTVSLADNDVGYIVAFQNCCRAASKTSSVLNLPQAAYREQHILPAFRGKTFYLPGITTVRFSS